MRTYYIVLITTISLLVSISVVFAFSKIPDVASTSKCETGYKNGPFFQQSGATGDSDGGYLPCKSGTVTTNNGDFADSCWGTSDTLTEYFIKLGSAWSYDVDCKNGCETNSSTGEGYCK